MTIVSPPFCLDFGGAYLNRPPDYSPEVWKDWEQQKSLDFEKNWPHMKKILSHFRTLGIHIADVNPATSNSEIEGNKNHREDIPQCIMPLFINA